MKITDDELRETLENGQLKIQRERGVDLTIFSPMAAGMGHHFGNEKTSLYWAQTCNEVIARVCDLYPRSFIGTCQLPQSPGVSPANCAAELERCVRELGFVGCNLNPDPSGGYWTDPPLTDRYWYPLYEKLVELDVPALIHVSASCNPSVPGTGAHYINGDTTAFMQLLADPQVFVDFPTLRLVIPHGGGAAPFQWGRYRGLALEMHRKELSELLMDNIWFDTCVYTQSAMEYLIRTVGVDHLLFASEMLGAVRGNDPLHGRAFDDTKKYVDATGWLSDDDRRRLFEGNATKVYPRLARRLASVAA